MQKPWSKWKCQNFRFRNSLGAPPRVTVTINININIIFTRPTKLALIVDGRRITQLHKMTPENLLASAGINIGIAIVILWIFSVLRNHHSNANIYYARRLSLNDPISLDPISLDPLIGFMNRLGFRKMKSFPDAALMRSLSYDSSNSGDLHD
ncbi:hypothetical protein R6Q59_006432 [Mikania micrantha]